MFQVRIHGRGGQGVVSAAEILSIAAFLEGKYAQAFPTFGSERMGAPVTGFCRIDEKPIRLREPIVAPDALIIQDPTLLQHAALFDGLSPSGYVLINSLGTFDALPLAAAVKSLVPERCCTLPASTFGLEHIGRAIPNAALLGGFAALTGLLAIDSVVRAIKSKFPGALGEKNAAAVQAGCRFVMERNLSNVEAG